MKRMLVAALGAGLGAGTMYALDPARGRRRRARLREAAHHFTHRATDIAGMTARDVEHRVRGVAVRSLDRLVEEAAPSDDVLAARVRARLGRLVSHPGAIEVSASRGAVTLRGPVFEAEVEQLMNGVRAVAGVTSIENRLESHRKAGRLSALQGPGPRHVPEAPGRWLRWTPTARLIAGMAGLALLALSSAKRPIRSAGTAIAGVELLERALFGSHRVTDAPRPSAP